MVQLHQQIIKQLMKFYKKSPSNNLKRIINQLKTNKYKLDYNNISSTSKFISDINIDIIIQNLTYNEILLLIINRSLIINAKYKPNIKYKIKSDEDVANMLLYIKNDYIIKTIHLYFV